VRGRYLRLHRHLNIGETAIGDVGVEPLRAKNAAPPDLIRAAIDVA
jgi:hypothetical protein